MIKVLVNDGIHPAGKAKLEDNGFQLEFDRVDQEDLSKELSNYDAILVRSATKVRKEHIDACPNLRLIGRGGVGLDNIDVSYAQEKGIKVINTPAASSRSVAELVIAHVLSLSRFLHQAHMDMPNSGHEAFKKLKKQYSKGIELQGKKLGIYGFGRIGRALGSLALGMGMEILPVDIFMDEYDLPLKINGHQELSIPLKMVALEEMLQEADIISLHLPAQEAPVIGVKELSMMKDGAILVNASRGGLIDEDALLDALNSGKIGGAGLDVFSNEPTPDSRLLQHPNVSTSPHIGGSTESAQANIGLELADQMIEFFKN